PDGQQQSSSVLSGFVSNMLNPNQDTGVDESVQPWLSNLAQQDPRESFDELTDSTC
ncbi:hypothetical protein Tco_1141538, partial [Tanacetum coccineum]